MLSVTEAQSLILQHTAVLSPETAAISSVCGRVLAGEIISPVDIPGFDQSAMDGYALIYEDVSGDEKTLEIIGEIKAGDTEIIMMERGKTVRIYTGASLPEKADCVVMQEKVISSNQNITVQDESLKQGDNVRTQGSVIKKGGSALTQGIVLSPAAVGFMASMGIEKVQVYSKPRISMMVTGNELEPLTTKKLPHGKIYESNSYTLLAALQQMDIIPQHVLCVKDNAEELKNSLNQFLQNSDMVVLSGGISVGKYDLVKETLLNNGVSEIFHKVSQKPGKPLFFGKKNSTLVVALPGNPAAMLVCFYEYIYPCLKKMQGFSSPFLPKTKSILLNPVKNKGDRALFLKAQLMQEGVIPLEGQESNSLRTFAEADCLIYIPSGTHALGTGQEVEVHLLP